MAGVTINRGEPSPIFSFEDVPREKWESLVQVKRDFIAVNIPYDCRCLLQFRKQAEGVWQELGYDSIDDMIRTGYRLDPAEVDTAYNWLSQRKPEWAVPFKQAVKLGQHGGDRKSQQAEDQGDNVTLIRGNQRTYTLARLHRDRPDLAEKVEAGELSANAAAIEAGFRRKLTRVERMQREWNNATPKERKQILNWLSKQ